MRSPRIVVPALAVALLSSTALTFASDAPPPISWNEWSETVLLQAQAENRLILLYIEAAWCLQCRQFEDEVLSDTTVREIVDRDYLAIRIDRDDHPDIARRYQYGELPAVAFLTAKGHTVQIQDGADLLRAAGSDLSVQQMRDFLPVVVKYQRGVGKRLDAMLEEQLRQGMRLRNRESRPISLEMVEIGANSVLRAQDPIHGGLEGSFRIVERMPVDVALERFEATGEREYEEFLRRTLQAMDEGPVWDPLTGMFYHSTRSPDWSLPVEGFLLRTQAEMLLLHLDAWKVLGEPALLQVAERLGDVLLDRFYVPDPGAFRAAIYPARRTPSAGISWDDLTARLSAKERQAAAIAWGLPASAADPPAFPRHAMSMEEVAAALELPLDRAEARLQAAAKKLSRGEDRALVQDGTLLSGDNAVASNALLQLWAVTGRDDLRDAALATIAYVGDQLGSVEDGVFHGMAADPSRVIPAVLLTDQVDMLEAWLVAFELTGDRTYRDYAHKLGAFVLKNFVDSIGGGFVDRMSSMITDAGDLRFPDRRLEENARAAAVLSAWSRMDPGLGWERQARLVLESFADEFTGYGTEAAAFGVAVERLLRPPVRVIVVDGGDPARAQELRRAAFAAAPLWKLVLPVDEAKEIARVQGLGLPPDGGTAAWVVTGDGLSGPLLDVPALQAAIRPADAEEKGR